MSLKKSEQQELIRLGARVRLRELEEMIGDLFADFPDLFVSATAPVFLRPEVKGGGSTWPTLTVTPTNGNGHVDDALHDHLGEEQGPLRQQPARGRQAGSWTPARRAAQSRRMKKHSLALHARRRELALAGKSEPVASGVRGGLPDQFLWQRVHNYLAGREGHSAKANEVLAGLNIDRTTKSATAPLYAAAMAHLDLFYKPKGGMFRLKKVMVADA